MNTDIENAERVKYRRVWSDLDSYRGQADGSPVVRLAWRGLRMAAGESLIDWGAGCGRPAMAFQDLGLRVTAFDIADNCLDAGVTVPLVTGTLWNPPAYLDADYGFCTDVLEHIPPALIRTCLAQLRVRSRKGCFIQVDTVADICGPQMDPPEVLHLTVQPADWWLAEISRYWIDVQMNRGRFTRWCFICK